MLPSVMRSALEIPVRRPESMASAPSGKPEPQIARRELGESLVGRAVEIPGWGWATVRGFDVSTESLALEGKRTTLSLNDLIHTGANAALGASGTAVSRVPAAKTPHWLERSERSTRNWLLSHVLGGKKVFPPKPLNEVTTALVLPDEVRRGGTPAWYFAANFIRTLCANPLEDSREFIEASGFRELRFFERDSALGAACVSSDGQTIVVGFRGATDQRDWIAATDYRTVSLPGVGALHRGSDRFLGRVREGLDAHVCDLLADHPDASLLVVGQSLGSAMATQWTSRGVQSGWLDPARVARVVNFAPVNGLDADAARWLCGQLDDRLDVVFAAGDACIRKKEIRRSYGDRVTELAPRPKTNGVLRHTLVELLRILKRDLDAGA